MATKSYSKHKEYKEFKSSGNVAPYTDEQFDMLKSDLIPKSKLASSLDHNGGHREYHYEYKEEKHPSGKYDRKDLHTVERHRDPLNKYGSLERNGGAREYHYQYNEDLQPSGRYDRRYAVEEFTVPPKSTPKSKEQSSYFYEREERELPILNSSSASKTYNYESSSNSTPVPGYSKVRSSTVKKDLSQNVEELDSLLDDLQKDQDRQLYKSGYTSDTAESSSFDYRKGTPAKAPSSGYSTLKKEERVETSSWGSSPPPTVARAAEIRQQLYREEKTESRVVPSQISPAIPHPVPAPVCANCHHSTLNTLNTVSNVSNTGTLTRSGTPGMNKVTTTVKTYTYEVPAGTEPGSVPLPVVANYEHSYQSAADHRSTSTTSQLVPASPALGCQHCAHCNSRITTTHVTSPGVVPHIPDTQSYHRVITSDDRTNERIVYPKSVNETKLVPGEPYLNGHAPYGPTNYKFSETTYSAHNTTERYPASPPAAAPFPRATTPLPADQQPPKRLDDLMADFPDARFPTQPDGVTHRKIQVTHESSTQSSKAAPPIGSSKNVAGPAVYYPPGHTPFEKKESAGYQSAAMQSGGAYASGRGMYEYESGSKSKQKSSEKKTAVPICLPLCCAMPCVIM